MTTITEISDWMGEIAPLALTESWDNTGLLLGCPDASVTRVQTCLTLTPASVREAIAKQANLVIAHHPLPFQPLAKITTHTVSGAMLWDLARNGIGIYAPHTAWDSAPLGINALLAQKLDLKNCVPLIPAEDPNLKGLGAGRMGSLSRSSTVDELARNLAACIPSSRPHGVRSEKPVCKVAIACGSGGSLLASALEQGCDLFLTGEATFHTCLEAEAAEVSLLMIGHYASERFAMEVLADKLKQEFSSVQAWASEEEQDPVVKLGP